MGSLEEGGDASEFILGVNPWELGLGDGSETFVSKIQTDRWDLEPRDVRQA